MATVANVVGALRSADELAGFHSRDQIRQGRCGDRNAIDIEKNDEIVARQSEKEIDRTAVAEPCLQLHEIDACRQKAGNRLRLCLDDARRDVLHVEGDDSDVVAGFIEQPPLDERDKIDELPGRVDDVLGATPARRVGRWIIVAGLLASDRLSGKDNLGDFDKFVDSCDNGNRIAVLREFIGDIADHLRARHCQIFLSGRPRDQRVCLVGEFEQSLQRRATVKSFKDEMVDFVVVINVNHCIAISIAHFA